MARLTFKKIKIILIKVDVKEIISMLGNARQFKRYVFICGNGGSACDSEHLAEDLLIKNVRAIALTNVGVITSLANDFDYSEVFSRQLEVYANKDDILITLSCSGTSKNIVNAQTKAKELGMSTIIFPTNNDTRLQTSLTQNEHKKLIHEIYEGL